MCVFPAPVGCAAVCCLRMHVRYQHVLVRTGIMYHTVRKCKDCCLIINLETQTIPIFPDSTVHQELAGQHKT